MRTDTTVLLLIQNDKIRQTFRLSDGSFSESRTISRVLSGMVIYLDLLLPAGSSDPPETRRAAASSLFGLASDGVYMARPVTRTAVVSYTAFPPLLSVIDPQRASIAGATRGRPLTAVYFCCTFLRVSPTGRYPASCPVKPGLSSPAAFRHLQPRPFVLHSSL